MSERLGYQPETSEVDESYIIRLETSRHESGHETVALSRGWFVTDVSTEQEGNTLGYTLISPPAGKSGEDLAIDYAAICLGGRIAAQMSGDTASGCDSDLQKAQAAISGASVKLGIPEFALWRQASEIAHGALKNLGSASLEKRAIFHATKGKAA